MSPIDLLADHRSNTILVDYPCLVDTDFGVVAYLISHYAKSMYFKEGYQDWTKYFIHCNVLSRKHINPLSAILKEEYFDQMDSLYQEILDKHWDEVIQLSSKTDISRIINTTYNYAGYRIMVNCRNQIEAIHIKKAKPDWDSVIKSAGDRSYFCYFVHDLDDWVAGFRYKVQAKAIYVYYHKPNFINMKEKFMNKSAMPIIRFNEMKIIEPYSGFKFPYDMTPDDVEVKNNGTNYKVK